MSIKTTMTALALSAIMASTAHADIRLKGGTVLVSTGDPIGKILKYKKPVKFYYGTVCTRLSNDRCSLRKNQGRGKIYEFKMPNRTYVVQTYRGTITYVEWKQ